MMTFRWCGLLGLAALCHAHMEMRLPPPRKSKYNPDYQSVGDVDNDMSAPLGDDVSPCLSPLTPSSPTHAAAPSPGPCTRSTWRAR